MNGLEVKGIRDKLGVSQEKLAEMVGVHPRTVQNWESGSKIPASKHAILRSLLLEPQQYSGGDIEEVEPTTLVPLLPVSALGGTLSDFSMQVMNADCEKIISPIKGVDFAITVAGDSMAPEYPSGSKIFIKKINEKAFLEWGKVYVLDTVNGTVIKEVRKGNDDTELECVSINPDPKFQPFTVKLADIYGIYRVLMCMAMK